MLLELLLSLFSLFVFVLVPSRRVKIFLVLLYGVSASVYLRPSLIYPFTAEKWKTASPFGRRLMARHFLRTHQPLGMTRSELEGYLGLPDWGDYWSYKLEVGPDVKDGIGRPVVNPRLGVAYSKTKVMQVDLPFPPSAVTRQSFDAELWKYASATARSQMVWDLYERKVLDGKSEEEVKHLLGPPDEGIPSERVSYNLGMYPFLMELDFYGLDFKLSKDNRVIAADVYQH